MEKNYRFAKRFVEACGTSRPSDIQRLLNISYQSAKNYLGGRVPKSDMLIAISETTSYSIDWLLTGRGKKFIDDVQLEDTPILAGQTEASVRRICVEVINEFIGQQGFVQPKVVVLQPGDVMSEKVVTETKTLTGRKT